MAAQFQTQDGVRPRGRLLVFDADGKPRGSYWTSGQGFAGLSFEFYMVLDAKGRCMVADEWNQRVVVFSDAMKPLFAWGEAGVGDGKFDHPKGVFAGPSGAVYAADRRNKRAQKFTLEGL